MANRTWSYFFGRGIIDPVDDIRGSNPPSNPDLLDALRDDFLQSGFDVRHLMRNICLSRTYQLSINKNKWNEDRQRELFTPIPPSLSANRCSMPLRLPLATVEVQRTPRRHEVVELPDGIVAGNDFLALFAGRSVSRPANANGPAT